MQPHESCEWCGGAGLVTLYREGYEGNPTMLVEELGRGGEVVTRRVPGRIAIHCRECGIGEHRYQQFKPEDKSKLWTTRHMLSDRPTYLQQHYRVTDPTYREIFTTWQDAIDWFSRRGNPADVLPDPSQGLKVRRPA